MNIDRSTLHRFIIKSKDKEVEVVGYSGTAQVKQVFTEDMEKDLADHIKQLADQFHGMTSHKCGVVS